MVEANHDGPRPATRFGIVVCPLAQVEAETAHPLAEAPALCFTGEMATFMRATLAHPQVPTAAGHQFGSLPPHAETGGST
jgi:hypothetical protein